MTMYGCDDCARTSIAAGCPRHQAKELISPKLEQKATPHRCPVCEGRGTVDAGFYSGQSGYLLSTSRETCRSCMGSGILWA